MIRFDSIKMFYIWQDVDCFWVDLEEKNNLLTQFMHKWGMLPNNHIVEK